MSALSPEEWKRVEPLVDALLDMPVADRARYLDEACAGDASLRANVEAVLVAGGGMSFLEAPAAQFASPLLVGDSDEDAELMIGVLVGPYRIVRELGRGGMGAVYLAERADGQFEQRVALKLIKRGMDSDEIYRRFRSERQILARLHHPHVARLFDGGVSDAGQPYFAMEYIDGVSITEHCDTHRLGIDERLRLFGAVCDAVRYAHQNLVVHRDLKPSNILVTTDGAVKLLDFGIAKMLREETADDGTLTQIGTRVMTPDYAAPEQVRGDPVTTSTDIYALGAILYELLTGRRAHRFASRTPAEVERVVCEVDPEMPSTAVLRPLEQTGKSEAIAPEAVSQARGADPTRLSRGLRGDLDTIVLTAMRKDSTRRYASTDALLDDLHRYSARLPIRARPDSLGYRARKFFQRHRVGVAAGAAIVVAVAAGFAGTVWQARVARSEAAKATAVKNFLTGLFVASDPVHARGRELTARELLDRGRAAVDTGLARQPELQIELLNVLASTYREIGFHPQSDTLFVRATQLATDTYGSESIEVATLANGWANTLVVAGQYEKADSVLTRALETHRRAGGSRTLVMSTAISNLASVYQAKGKFDRSEELYREALAIERKLYGDRHLDVAKDLNSLGVLLWRVGRHAAADSAVRASLEIRQALLDPDHPDVIISQHNLAAVLQAKGDAKGAEQLEREVIAKRRRLYPGGHDNIAVALQQLQDILNAQGRYEEAEAALVEALAIRRQWLGADHPETSALVANLGVINYRMRRLPEAAAATREALDLFRRTLGREHPTTLTTLNNLGAILGEQGENDEAESLLREALALRTRTFGDSSVPAGQTLRNLGLVHYRRREYAQAEAVFRRVRAIYQSKVAATHFMHGDALTGLGMVLAERGCSTEGEQVLRQALEIRTKSHGATDIRTAETARTLGVCLAALGKIAEAETHLLASHEGFRANRFAARDLAETRRRLVAFYDASGRQADAARYR